ncbi:oxidoreductase [Agromyces luteolus]|uniref:Gfo/Idh/MocA family oxidoreductase n=1 Tax=Agromyces luteolus TaxID=88373 RepID=A0A7C9LY55_9MICO|nr:Gfo/Idh/MocA family oxidoreductase [Agromyces luteolus]MUN08639.1 gfo/Idh/MocA family oxidoreductase [Agromyces luteolus]GLK27179.1 oxidoreductase [Agromyces luteolus]
MLPEYFPEPTIYTPDSGEPTLAWGILGPGWIAGVWADTVAANTAQRVVAVGSRSRDRAEAFAVAHGIERAHGSYEALVADPGVDVVYIATPQSEHLSLGLMAIAAGKHVLIEKPLAMTRVEVDELAAAARSADVLLMEGMWTRYLPQASVIRTLVSDGWLGEVSAVVADHGQAIPVELGHRLYRPELGGGALLDLGIYPVQLDSMLLGAPTEIVATGRRSDSGVDETVSLVLRHGARNQSTIFTSIATRTPSKGHIAGTDGRLELLDSINGPSRLLVSDGGWFTPQREWDDPTDLRDLAALAWEATALATFVGEGRRESPVHTLEETAAIIDTLDRARRLLGVRWESAVRAGA